MKRIIYLFLLIFAQQVYAQSDCISAIPVCGNNSISYNPSSAGNIMEPTNPSCLADEHYSVWYTFTAANTGTLGFTITPNTVPGTTHYDYDFALYGPNFDCNTGNYGTPISCNFSGASGPTGLSATQTGSQWNPLVNVVAGETYVLLIDNYIPSNPYGFELTWEGSASLQSPFTPTIQPNPFIPPGPNQDGVILICTNPQLFDFAPLSAGILNGNPNFSIAYYLNTNDAITGTNPITAPINVSTANTYYYAISYTDPTNPSNPANVCKEYGTIQFQSGAITVFNPTIFTCNNNNTNIGVFDLTTANVFPDPTATIEYYPTLADANAGTNIITNPTAYTSAAGQVYALVTTTLGCTNVGTVTLAFNPLLPLTPATLTACNNNNSGVAYFDLTTADVYTDPAAPKKFYPSLTDLLADTNEITNPQQYLSAQGQVYVEVTGAQGCKNYTMITLDFHPVVVTQAATLITCFLPDLPTFGEFDLTTAPVSTAPGAISQFYLTEMDALNDTNMITNPYVYISENGSVYARVFGENLCWSIAKITLVVTPPSYSSVLTDKTICIEDRTTLDAGPGFDSYLWSTGETTQAIANVTVGEYWVDLGKNNCITRQIVKVNAAPAPVITGLDITNNTITVTISGGMAPYEYSLDGVEWQTSNVFNQVPRGQATIFVRDSYNCEPIIREVTVPNLVNAITPNGDNVNDYVDYSALHYKKNLVFTIYNRYGNKIFEANRNNQYKWDGRSGGKKVPTGTYWYTITWNEPDTDIPVKYDGWILVKNRD